MNVSFDIEKKSQKTSSFRVEKLFGMFDLNEDHLKLRLKGNIVIPDKWNVGVIVGRSGTGKTSIARKLWKVFETTYGSKPIIDEMQQTRTVEEITKTFTQVGFSSPPRWLNRYADLSNGEKMRVDLAKALLSDDEVIVFDEFTSVVDRDVAKICSIVISKNIRKNNRKFIAVSCHYDILDYIDADWIFSTDEMKMLELKKKDQLMSKYTKQTETFGVLLTNITI